MKTTLTVVALLFLANLAPAQTVRYVAPDGQGDNRDNDCRSVSNPCATIQYALDTARDLDEIRLLAGVFTEQITITKSVLIRGQASRAWSTIQAAENATGASGRVITIPEGDVTVEISNVYIRYGNASGAAPNNRGGGIYSFGNNLTIRNAGISFNSANNPVQSNLHRDASGGGIYLEEGSAVLANVLIHDNEAEGSGGGIFIHESAVVMNDVTIQQNHAGVNNDPDLGLFTGLGGGMYLYEGDPTFQDVEISQNTGIEGGGVFSRLSNPVFINVNFDSNMATERGGGMHITRGFVRTFNTRFINNSGQTGRRPFWFSAQRRTGQLSHL